MSDTGPFFRTSVTFEVLTSYEAFNGSADMLGEMVAAGDASAMMTARTVEEVPAEWFHRLEEVHDACGGVPEHLR